MYIYNDMPGEFYNEKEILQCIGDYYDFSMDAYNILLMDLYGNAEWANFVLEISPEFNLDSDSCAIFGCYGIGTITIYLYTILKSIPTRYVCTMIISTMVHELKHAGQRWASINDFESEQDFINTVERPVEWETLQYLVEKREYLEDRLGINIDLVSIKRNHLKYPVYSMASYEAINPENYWPLLLGKLYYGDSDTLLKIQDAIIHEQTIAIQLIYDEEKENRTFYSYSQYIKYDGLIVYPDREIIKLLNAISNVDKYGYTIRAAMAEDGKTFLIRSKYRITYNSPLIKYDEPCTT